MAAVLGVCAALRPPPVTVEVATSADASRYERHATVSQSSGVRGHHRLVSCTVGVTVAVLVSELPMAGVSRGRSALGRWEPLPSPALAAV